MVVLLLGTELQDVVHSAAAPGSVSDRGPVVLAAVAAVAPADEAVGPDVPAPADDIADRHSADMAGDGVDYSSVASAAVHSS